MSMVEVSIKWLMQKRPRDWITYLLPQHENTPFDVVIPDKVSNAESWMDSLWKIRDGEGSFYLHFEPQGYLDAASQRGCFVIELIPGNTLCREEKELPLFDRWLSLSVQRMRTGLIVSRISAMKRQVLFLIVIGFYVHGNWIKVLSYKRDWPHYILYYH